MKLPGHSFSDWRAAAPVLAALLACAPGCREAPPPSWVRLEGASPRLEAAPATRAQLVVFWATWCEPCRRETPQLRALAANPPEGLAVVVFSHDDDDQAVRAFFGGPPEPALHLRLDPGRSAAEAFGVQALPVSFLVVDGRLVARFTGPREWDSPAMRKLLGKLLQPR